MHRPPRPVLLLLLLLLVGGGYLGYRLWAGREAAPGRMLAAGTIEGDRVLVAAESSGRIVRLLAGRGDLVEAGQPLVYLDDALLQLQYRQAPAGGPEQQRLRLQLERLVLRAPAAGIVSERAVEVGEMAMAGAPLLTIERQGDVELILYVSERQIGRLHVGQPIRVTSEALPGHHFTGAIESIAPRAEFTPRTIQTPKDRALLVYAARARLPNPDDLLKPGMAVEAEIAE